MKKYLILCVMAIFVLVSVTFGQKKNTVEVSFGGFKIYNVLEYNPAKFNMIGLRYSRYILDRLNVYTAISRAPISGRYLAAESYATFMDVGKLIYRVKFNYVDLGANYTFLRLGNSAFSVDGGVSLAFGKNDYLKQAVWSDPEPGELYGDPFHVEYTTKHEQYLGGVLGLGYTYSLWQNRISVGGKIASRFYSGGFPFQVNYNLAAAFNF